METISLCPFAVGTLIWQGHDGAFTLTTCVKGTFSLVHGRDALIAEQQEPIGVDRYFAGAGASLYAPTDIVPYKPRTDILLVGHAFAPKGKPVEALVARFSIGDVSKGVGIVGDRIWSDGPYGLEPAPPAPFMKMPLRYERAAKAASNPIGVDLAALPIAGGRALPNLEAIDDETANTSAVGFGPISPAWSARKGLLSGDALAWVVAGGRGPIPDGFDFGFYNAAPRDQQVDLLRQNAKIILENLHPDHPRLETRLPPIRPKAFLVDRTTQRGSEIALRCDTVWIDTDRSIAIVTWRGLTGVETGDPRALGTIAVAAELKGKELRFKHVERLLREEGFTSADTESFAMSDVNPLNVRYDGVTLATVPQTADDPPTQDGSSAPTVVQAGNGPRQPSLAPGFHWTPGDGGLAPLASAPFGGRSAGGQGAAPFASMPALAPPTYALAPPMPAPIAPDTPTEIEELTNSELTTQQIPPDEPQMRMAIALAEQRGSAPEGLDPDAPSITLARAPVTSVHAPSPPSVSAQALPPPPVGAQALPPPPVRYSPDDDAPEEGEMETARIRIRPMRMASIEATAHAAPAGIPRPAMVDRASRPFTGQTEPPLPPSQLSPPPEVPRPPPMLDLTPRQLAGYTEPLTPPGVSPPPSEIPRPPPMVDLTPRRPLAGRTEPLPPSRVLPPPTEIPRPAMVDLSPRPPDVSMTPPVAPAQPSPPELAPRGPQSVSLEDYARIVIALERGDLARIASRLKMDASEIERAKIRWAERVRSEPALTAVFEEALEAARRE